MVHVLVQNHHNTHVTLLVHPVMERIGLYVTLLSLMSPVSSKQCDSTHQRAQVVRLFRVTIRQKLLPFMTCGRENIKFIAAQCINVMFPCPVYYETCLVNRLQDAP